MGRDFRMKGKTRMFYVLLALLLFVGSVTAHIFYCRHASQEGLHAKAYLCIAFVFFIIYALAILMSRQAGAFQERSLWGLPFKMTAGVVFILLVPSYLVFYILTQLMSPSKKILLAMARRGALSYADIVACVREEGFIEGRLKDLCASQCVRCDKGRYSLTSSGRKIAAVLNVLQGVFGRDMGG